MWDTKDRTNIAIVSKRVKERRVHIQKIMIFGVLCDMRVDSTNRFQLYLDDRK